jgi:hypothetical protein
MGGTYLQALGTRNPNLLSVEERKPCANIGASRTKIERCSQAFVLDEVGEDDPKAAAN